MSGSYDRAAQLLSRSNRAVGFTGAGASADSGIPTFRDPGGVWDQFRITNLIRHPFKIREYLLNAVDTLEMAQVNPGHEGFKQLEDMGILKIVITQNIDDLHNIAGNSNVIELHGNLYRSRCSSCGNRQKLERKEAMAMVRKRLEQRFVNPMKVVRPYPRCRCGGKTRPDVVNFGESVQCLDEAFRASAGCDLMLILGTSGVVYPASAMPFEAKKRGAKIIEINPKENSFRNITDVFIKATAAESMPLLVEKTRQLVE